MGSITTRRAGPVFGRPLPQVGFGLSDDELARLAEECWDRVHARRDRASASNGADRPEKKIEYLDPLHIEEDARDLIEEALEVAARSSYRYRDALSVWRLFVARNPPNARILRRSTPATRQHRVFWLMARRLFEASVEDDSGGLIFPFHFAYPPGEDHEYRNFEKAAKAIVRGFSCAREGVRQRFSSGQVLQGMKRIEERSETEYQQRMTALKAAERKR